jgi:hypothetical protein
MGDAEQVKEIAALPAPAVSDRTTQCHAFGRPGLFGRDLFHSEQRCGRCNTRFVNCPRSAGDPIELRGRFAELLGRIEK